MNFENHYFVGQAKSAIDGKGRCAFPREFRRQMTPEDGNVFVLTNWGRNKLRLFVMGEYEKFIQGIEQSLNRGDARKFRLALKATVLELDGQNRILLPKDKLQFAELTNSVTFVDSVGGKSLELWNTEAYEAESLLETEDGLAMFEALCNGETSGSDNVQK